MSRLGSRLVQVLVAALVVCIAMPSQVDAQSLAGRVLDESSDTPVEGVLVRVPSANLVTVTDDDGRFSLTGLRGDSAVVEMSRLGYESLVATLPVTRDVTVLISRAPVQLDGVGTRVGFQSVEEVASALDRRYAGFRGTTRTVSADVIREYDDEHASDPYALLSGELDTFWDFGDVFDKVWVNRYGRTTVEAFLDERQTSLRTLIEFPNEQLCHANIYTPIKVLGPIPYREPPPQLRFYSCSYMARVLGGLETLPRRVCWGGLISGPRPSRGLGGCMRTDYPGWADPGRIEQRTP